MNAELTPLQRAFFVFGVGCLYTLIVMTPFALAITFMIVLVR